MLYLKQQGTAGFNRGGTASSGAGRMGTAAGGPQGTARPMTAGKKEIKHVHLKVNWKASAVLKEKQQ